MVASMLHFPHRALLLVLTLSVAVLGIYMYVPLQHRVMITSVGNLGWSTYLSMKSRFQAVQP
eukprot:132980-Hanusia_phi.AAC.1